MTQSDPNGNGHVMIELTVTTGKHYYDALQITPVLTIMPHSDTIMEKLMTYSKLPYRLCFG